MNMLIQLVLVDTTGKVVLNVDIDHGMGYYDLIKKLGKASTHPIVRGHLMKFYDENGVKQCWKDQVIKPHKLSKGLKDVGVSQKT